MQNVKFENIVETDLFWENPDICLVSPIYDENFMVTHHGERIALDMAKNHISHSEIPNEKKEKFKSVLKLLLFPVVAVAVNSLPYIIKIEFTPLFKETGFWKYLVAEISALSFLLLSFLDIAQFIVSKTKWTKRCALNRTVFAAGKIKKCTIFDAKKDLRYLFSNTYIHPNLKNRYPYGFDYYRNVVKAFDKIDNGSMLHYEYEKNLERILAPSDFIRCILSFLLGLIIQLFTSIDFVREFPFFRNNTIVISTVLLVFSAITAFGAIFIKANESYVRLDAILYIYSYMFLDMPFTENGRPFVSLEIDANVDKSYEFAVKEYYLQNLSEEKNTYFYVRLAQIHGNTLKVFYDDYSLQKISKNN